MNTCQLSPLPCSRYRSSDAVLIWVESICPRKYHIIKKNYTKSYLNSKGNMARENHGYWLEKCTEKKHKHFLAGLCRWLLRNTGDQLFWTWQIFLGNLLCWLQNSWSMVIIKIDSMFRNLKSSIMICSSYNLKKEFSSCIEKRSQINS